MKISVVIPNYNGKDILKKNLPKVMAFAKNCEIIIVDDASTDGSVEMLAKEFPQIKIIKRSVNEGFSSTVNTGVKIASGELIVLLNSDVYPKEGFLQYVLPYFNDQKVFAVGFLQKSLEKGKIVLRGRGIGQFKGGFLLHARGAVSGEDTSEVAEWTPRMVEESKKTLWVSGGAGIFRKSIWMELGGMDTLYNPFYWEDIDLSYRALKAGYKLVFEPKSIVYHQQEQGAIRSKYSQEEIKTIAYRNQIIFVWLNITDVPFMLQHFLNLPFLLLKAIISGDCAFIKAFFAAFFKLPKVLVHRWHNQKLSKISDRELLGNYLS